ncbi:MAG: metallophosphoesterase family protein [Pirellulales bacterium]
MPYRHCGPTCQQGPLLQKLNGFSIAVRLVMIVAFCLTAWPRHSAADEAETPLETDKQLIAKITKPAGTLPIHWRVTWREDPATKAVVSWNTIEEGAVHRLHLRSEDGSRKEVLNCQRNGRCSGDGHPLFYHHARLSELKPATKYFVQMESDGKKSAEFWFLTAPAADKSVQLLFGGDSRSGHTQRRFMNRRMARLLKELPGILALAHGGDYIVDGRRLDQWWLWMADHELTVTDDGRLLPVIPARGNHDSGPLFNEIFDFPPDDLNYYAVRLTPQVRWITLNTETSMAGDQKEWLQAELAAARPEHRWVAAQYHRPAWPAVKRPSSALQHCVPLFEQYNIDLVCEADGHNLKRTVPIRAGKQDPTGIVYIGEGGLGVGQRQPKTDRWFLQKPGMAIPAHNVQLLTFSNDRLDYKAIGMDGATLDEHVFSPREK